MDNSRTELLIGKENIDKIKRAKIAIVGAGGVGGNLAVLLVRSGVENLTIFDFDKVESSNLNRQAQAFIDTIGLVKVDALKEYLHKINEKAKIDAINVKLTKDNIERYIQNFDIVVDAIDIVSDKIELICYCIEKGIKIVSAMGAGNRIDSPKFIVEDIYKTHDDGLAKVLRKNLKLRGIKKHDVVYCPSKPIKIEGQIGSISYFPMACACSLASYVINFIVESWKSFKEELWKK